MTSVKVPLPLLRNSQDVVPRYASGRAVRLVLAIEAAEHVGVGRPPDVVADEQVEQPVAIDIDPDRRRAERLARVQAAALGDVDETALAGVAKQTVLADAGDQQVREAVVVPVADGHAHPVHLDVQARRPGDVRERAVAVVAIQRERRTFSDMARPIHPVDEQNVLPPVGVVVQERAAGAERFRQQLAAVRAAIVREGEPRRGRDVDEAETERPSPGAGFCAHRGRRHGAADSRKERAAIHESVTRPLRIA